VVADVLDAGVAQLAVAQPRHRVVFVEPLQRFGGRLDVPLDQRRAERLGDLDRQHGLAGARLAFDQQWPLQRDRGIDRNLEVVGGDVAAGSFETHEGSARLGPATGATVYAATMQYGPEFAMIGGTGAALKFARQHATGASSAGRDWSFSN